MCIGMAPPAGCSYSSHSLSIGSLTEIILLSESTVAVLPTYEWSHTSEGMASIYFDRRIPLFVKFVFSPTWDMEGVTRSILFLLYG